MKAGERNEGCYEASAEELAGIDRGLADVAQGRLASAADVQAVFRKHRDAVDALNSNRTKQR